MASILAADIGGTNSRFGRFEADPGQEPRMLEARTFPTDSAASFPQMLAKLSASGFGLDPMAADRVVLAVAGPVRDGRRCSLTNAAWGIDLDDPAVVLPQGRTELVNDFVAQAFGAGTAHAAGSSVAVQEGPGQQGLTAAIGAGTGLGLCALAPLPGGGVLPLPSEGGHAPLAMVRGEEFAFLEYLKGRTGHSHAFGDIVVSGPGLSLLHEFLTGRRLSPSDVAREIGPESETTRWFARFFGRACRAYVLHVLAWAGVFLCGGLAAKNPFLVVNEVFLGEFRDCPAYGANLARIPIRLVTAPDVGLHGAASYAMSLPSRAEVSYRNHSFVS